MRASDFFAKWFSEDQLKETFANEVFTKPTVGIDYVTVNNFNEHIDENIGVIRRKVFAGNYRFTNYAQVLLPKGANKPPREICIPTVRDKLVLKSLSKVIADVYGDVCKTPQPQLTVDEVHGAMVDGDYTGLLKYDIHACFSSIDHDILLKLLRARIRKPQILSLLEGAIMTLSVPFGVKAREPKRCKGVPEGLPISGLLANIYLNQVDKSIRSIKGIGYHRYVDDILVLGTDANLNRADRVISTAVARLNLELSGDKTQSGKLAVDAFDYLGYRFFGSTLSVGSKAKRRIEQRLEALIRQYDGSELSKWRLNLRITGCRWTDDGLSFMRYGWLHYYSRTEDVAYLGRLDSLVKKLFKRRGIEYTADIKRFKRAYYEMKKADRRSRYIRTIDTTISVEEKRDIIRKLFQSLQIDNKTDEEVNGLYCERMRRELKDLEHDADVIS